MYLLQDIVNHQANIRPDAPALSHKGKTLTYIELNILIDQVANFFLKVGLIHQDRVAIYLPKCEQTVISFFGITTAGGAFVPINPLLKAEQVLYILNDCNVKILVTSKNRLDSLASILPNCHDLHTAIVLEDNYAAPDTISHLNLYSWQDLLEKTSIPPKSPILIDTDMAAILYTSGSTGKPKGVVLSHRNMVVGAKSVAQYLENNEHDRILAVLPFSFDYGLSQLTTAFLSGACVVLMDYLFPRDVIKMVTKENITGLAAVPPLWNQISKLPWPDEAINSLRYITNSGGAMPLNTISELKTVLPKTNIYLMYGLTEAFRSTYLPPEEIDRRPGSMGKAIPNAEILVVREDGTHCSPNEPGELVHRGSLVALGYWNDPSKTNERFKPIPNQLPGLPITELAVWSGDTVKMDEDGYLYFISRKDEMIKTSGYRVSPTEVEEVIYTEDIVKEVAIFGVPHSELGQAIVGIATAASNHQTIADNIIAACKKHLPAFMVPIHIEIRDSLPKNPNGKIDRNKLHQEMINLFVTDN